jgi:hypothetical protein
MHLDFTYILSRESTEGYTLTCTPYVRSLPWHRHPGTKNLCFMSHSKDKAIEVKLSQIVKMKTTSGGIAQRYHHTRFQPYSPSGYETCSANGRWTPRHGNSSPDPGELKMIASMIHCFNSNICHQTCMSTVLGTGSLQWHFQKMISNTCNTNCNIKHNWNKIRQYAAKASMLVSINWGWKCQGLFIRPCVFDSMFRVPLAHRFWPLRSPTWLMENA